MLFEFVLFALLGICMFVTLPGNGKMVAMIVFIVLMVVWLIVGITGFGFGHLNFPR